MNTDAGHGTHSLRGRHVVAPSGGTLVKHLLALLFTVGGLIATVYVFLHTGTGQWIDETALAEVSHGLVQYRASSSELLNAMPAIAGIFALLGLLFVLIRRHRFLPAVVGLLAAGAANGTTQILKRFVLEKPDLGIQEAALNSMPSGHTTFAASAGAALFIAAPKRWRPAVSLLMMAFTVATGVATVIKGWHRPADVLAAIFVVGAWTVLGLLALRFIPAEDRDPADTRHSGMLTIPLYTIMGLFMGFCSMATYVVARSEHLAGAALLGSLCLISSVSLITTAVLVGLLRVRPRSQDRVYTKVWTY